MTNVAIRPAHDADVPAITHIAHDAFGDFIPLIGRAPEPMLLDYRRLVAEDQVWVLVVDAQIIGLAVLTSAKDHLLLRTLAVAPAGQRSGHGRRLIAFAEAEALRRGFAEIRVLTHVTMRKTISLYRDVGFEEYERVDLDGYFRMCLRKRLKAPQQ